MMGALASIDKDGFPSAAFHANPAILKWDTYTGDCGPNFFSFAINTGTYLIKHPNFGWQAFGGEVRTSGRLGDDDATGRLPNEILRGAVRSLLTLDAGTFESVSVNAKTHAGAPGTVPG